MVFFLNFCSKDLLIVSLCLRNRQFAVLPPNTHPIEFITSPPEEEFQFSSCPIPMCTSCFFLCWTGKSEAPALFPSFKKIKSHQLLSPIQQQLNLKPQSPIHPPPSSRLEKKSWLKRERYFPFAEQKTSFYRFSLISNWYIALSDDEVVVVIRGACKTNFR